MTPEINQNSSTKKYLIYYLRKITLLKNIYKEKELMNIKDEFSDDENELIYYYNDLGINSNIKLRDMIKYDDT